ncbi:MAG TPA: MarR family transcriptional regulator [Trueperaceae bacterium]|nr:MarR family transcriptional regulator [Trueperaceae bacterium]
MPATIITPEREQLGHEIGEALFHLIWRYRQQADQSFAPLGVNSLRALMLGLIARERLHPKALADTLDLAPPAISHILTDLEERGLIARSLDPEDRRRVLLEITDAGRTLLSRVAATWNGLNVAKMAALTEDEVVAFRDLLRKITADA